MLVVTRFRIEPGEASSFLHQARAALTVLAGCPGWRSGNVGRALDDATLWLMTTEWQDVGSYRRALSAYEVKMTAEPLLAQALDEPTAFELLTATDPHGTALAADAGVVRVGEAAAPSVATDLD